MVGYSCLLCIPLYTYNMNSSYSHIISIAYNILVSIMFEFNCNIIQLSPRPTFLFLCKISGLLIRRFGEMLKVIQLSISNVSLATHFTGLQFPK